MTETDPTSTVEVSKELAIETVARMQLRASLRSKVVFTLGVPTAFVVLLPFFALITGAGGAVAAAWFLGGAVFAIGLGISEARRNKLRRNLALALDALLTRSAAATLDGDVLEIRAGERWRFPLARRDVRALKALPEARLLLRD